jgi:hypothetical protein
MQWKDPELIGTLPPYYVSRLENSRSKRKRTRAHSWPEADGVKNETAKRSEAVRLLAENFGAEHFRSPQLVCGPLSHKPLEVSSSFDMPDHRRSARRTHMGFSQNRPRRNYQFTLPIEIAALQVA